MDIFPVAVIVRPNFLYSLPPFATLSTICEHSWRSPGNRIRLNWVVLMKEKWAVCGTVNINLTNGEKNATLYLLIRWIDLDEYFSWNSRHLWCLRCCPKCSLESLSQQRQLIMSISEISILRFQQLCICYSRVYFQTKYKTECFY